MSMLVAQIVFGIMIVFIGYLCFKFDKTQITTKDMVSISLLCVIAAVLAKFISIQIPPNSPVFVIGFSMSIMVIIGLIYNPKLCFIAGIMIDVIGLLFAGMQGQGFTPFLGFTLVPVIQCLIPSVSIKYLKNKTENFMTNSIIAILVIFNAIAFYFVNSRDVISIDQIKTELNSETRIVFMLLVVVMSVAVVFITKYLQKKYQDSQNKVSLNVTTLTFIVLVVQILGSIILTSLNITIMYGAPFEVGASTRIIKDVILLPIDVIIILTILRLIPNEYKVRKI